MANPFFNYTRAQCEVAIASIQRRLALNALQIAHAGSGTVMQAAMERDERNVDWLRQRMAELDGLPDPTAPRLKRWRIR